MKMVVQHRLCFNPYFSGSVTGTVAAMTDEELEKAFQSLF